MFKNQNICTPEELYNCLDNKKLVVFDCRYSLQDTAGGYWDYQNEHIPGAIYADLDAELSGKKNPKSGRHPIPNEKDFAEFLSNSGVENDTAIVCYEYTSGPFAARMWWLCKYFGLNNVWLLDGGFKAWKSITDRVGKGPIEPEKRKGKVTLKPHKKLLVETAEIEKNLDKLKGKIIDARDNTRFRGEADNMDKVAGHIPGSINLPFSTNLNSEGMFLDSDILRARFLNSIQATPAEEIISSCGSGITACLNILAMDIAGLQGAKLYAGSWSEWITDPNRPVEKG